MKRNSRADKVMRTIIEEFGGTIDLKAKPGILIEIVRKHGFDLAGVAYGPDGGSPPGGVGPVGPTSGQFGPTLEEVMKEILKLQRQVAKLTREAKG